MSTYYRREGDCNQRGNCQIGVRGEKFPFEWVEGQGLRKSDTLNGYPFLRSVKSGELWAC